MTEAEEAIRGYTAHGAYFTREEDIKGTIEPGKLADLVVLSDDLLEIDPEKILEVEVLITILDGKVVHDELEDPWSALPSTDQKGRVAQQVIDLQ